MNTTMANIYRGENASPYSYSMYPFEVNFTTQMTTDLLDTNLKCDFINTKYSVLAAILSVMCFMFGILYTFFGK